MWDLSFKNSCSSGNRGTSGSNETVLKPLLLPLTNHNPPSCPGSLLHINCGSLKITNSIQYPESDISSHKRTFAFVCWLYVKKGTLGLGALGTVESVGHLCLEGSQSPVVFSDLSGRLLNKALHQKQTLVAVALVKSQ